jgi:hypothetical protein
MVYVDGPSSLLGHLDPLAGWRGLGATVHDAGTFTSGTILGCCVRWGDGANAKAASDAFRCAQMGSEMSFLTIHLNGLSTLSRLRKCPVRPKRNFQHPARHLALCEVRINHVIADRIPDPTRSLAITRERGILLLNAEFAQAEFVRLSKQGLLRY